MLAGTRRINRIIPRGSLNISLLICHNKKFNSGNRKTRWDHAMAADCILVFIIYWINWSNFRPQQWNGLLLQHKLHKLTVNDENPFVERVNNMSNNSVLIKLIVFTSWNIIHLDVTLCWSFFFSKQFLETNLVFEKNKWFNWDGKRTHKKAIICSKCREKAVS